MSARHGKKERRRPAAAAPPAKPRRSLMPWLAALAIAAVTFLAYSRCYRYAFTNWDDNDYSFYAYQQLQKLHVSWSNITSFFAVPVDGGHWKLAYVQGNFHPLSMLSMTLDYALSPPAAPGCIPPVQPVVYHAVNIALHTANTLLVFLLIYIVMSRFAPKPALGKNGSSDGRGVSERASAIAAFTALLFGIHPLHVESVAWISERKDVLYAFWFLCSLILYVCYLTRKRPVWYALSLAAFLFSLLSKGQAVSLALLLTLFDVVAGRRLLDKKVLLEKAPFYGLALVFGIIALQAQAQASAIPNLHYNPWLRMVFAVISLSLYLLKAIAPISLSAVYPYPDLTNGLPASYYLSFILVIALAWLIICNYKRAPALLFGGGFFLITIFFLLQLVPVGRAMIADRYMYLASIGLFFCAAILVESAPLSYRWGARGLMLIYAAALLGLTINRTAVWKDSITMWNDCIDKYQNVSIAYHNRASIRHDAKDFVGAISDETKAIRLEPTLADAYYNRANSELTLGDREAAIRDNTICIKYSPGHYLAYYLRASALMGLGRNREALADFDTSIQINPQFKIGYYGRAICREQAGDRSMAIADYGEVIRLDGGYADAYFQRAQLYLQANNGPAACADFQMAMRLGRPVDAGQVKSACR